MEKYHANRLVKLAQVLKTVKKENFYLGTWFDGDGGITEEFSKAGIEIDKAITDKQILECNTTACALGWAASIPAFQRLGLKLEFDRHDDVASVSLYDKTTGERITDDSFEAARVFFGLRVDEEDTFEDANEPTYLFSPESYYSELEARGVDTNQTYREIDTHITTKDVINHIKKVLTDNGYKSLIAKI
jgi:hypothetical protein